MLRGARNNPSGDSARPSKIKQLEMAGRFRMTIIGPASPINIDEAIMSTVKSPIKPDPVIECYKKDIDRTLIRENLKMSHEDRLIKLMQLQGFAEELRRAGTRARRKRS